MGKLGGRSRQWLLDGLSNEYKPIPEYGLRIILAFSPRTSFLVPLDRCVQFATAAIKQGAPAGKSCRWAAIGLLARGLGLLWLVNPSTVRLPCLAQSLSLPAPPKAAHSEHQQKNAIRLVHVCLGTVIKAGLPRPAAMEGAAALAALQEALLQGAPRACCSAGLLTAASPLCAVPCLWPRRQPWRALPTPPALTCRPPTASSHPLQSPRPWGPARPAGRSSWESRPRSSTARSSRCEERVLRSLLPPRRRALPTAAFPDSHPPFSPTPQRPPTDARHSAAHHHGLRAPRGRRPRLRARRVPPLCAAHRLAVGPAAAAGGASLLQVHFLSGPGRHARHRGGPQAPAPAGRAGRVPGGTWVLGG